MVSSTLRMPDEIRRRLRARASAEGRSINEIVVEILDRETRRWQALEALKTADEVREIIREHYGELPDSTPVVRELRDERASRG